MPRHYCIPHSRHTTVCTYGLLYGLSGPSATPQAHAKRSCLAGVAGDSLTTTDGNRVVEGRVLGQSAECVPLPSRLSQARLVRSGHLLPYSQ